MKKQEGFPLTFGKHVIVDRRSGATFTSEKHSADHALVDVMKELGEESYLSEPEKDRAAMMEWVFTRVKEKMGLARYVPPSDGILRCGPYETQDSCLEEKNACLFLSRFRELAERHGTEGDVAMVDYYEEEVPAESPQDSPADVLERTMAEVMSAGPSGGQGPIVVGLFSASDLDAILGGKI